MTQQPPWSPGPQDSPYAGATYRPPAYSPYATLFYLGYLWPLWDAKRQTFADKICSTVVLAY
jgi:hypothetical protein